VKQNIYKQKKVEKYTEKKEDIYKDEIFTKKILE